MDTCAALMPTVSNLANLMTLQFTVRQDERLRMPEHAGSMLRGAFGVALRSLTCITDLPECKQCPLKLHCKFPAIFENPAIQSALVQPVNPYIIHVPTRSLSRSTDSARANHRPSQHERPTDNYSNGDVWQFGMTLMGSATTEIELIIQAWQLALQTGLGSHAPYQRATLLSVTTDDKTLYCASYDPAKRNINTDMDTKKSSQVSAITNNRRRSITLWQQLQTADASAKLTLKFLTPFRYQQDNRIVSQPNNLDSTTFIASLYNRIRLCQDNHSPNQIWDIGYDSYHDFKNDIATLNIDIDVAANHVARRSNRQQRKMALYGMQGDIHLSGNNQIISRLLPALLLGEQLHIGKNTTMGLGQYQLMLTSAS